jgi:hypothetical protein
MTRDDFLRAIRDKRIDPDAFVLDRDQDERYVLLSESNIWRVYYSERGQRTDECQFATESEALARLLDMLERDHTARWPGGQ